MSLCYNNTWSINQNVSNRPVLMAGLRLIVCTCSAHTLPRCTFDHGRQQVRHFECTSCLSFALRVFDAAKQTLKQWAYMSHSKDNNKLDFASLGITNKAAACSLSCRCEQCPGLCTRLAVFFQVHLVPLGLGLGFAVFFQVCLIPRYLCANGELDGVYRCASWKNT